MECAVSLAKKPQLSVCCGHTFCESCIERAKKAYDAFKCPVCRSDFSCFVNKQADRMIQNLKIFCVYKRKGVSAWQGVVSSVSDYLLKNCGFRTLDCPRGCGLSIQRQRIFWHVENGCMHRIVNCPHCLTAGEHHFIIGKHKDNCPNFLLPCPNNCLSSKMPPRSITNILVHWRKLIVPMSVE